MLSHLLINLEFSSGSTIWYCDFLFPPFSEHWSLYGCHFFYLPIFRFSWYVYTSFTLGLTCIFHGACHFIYPCFCDKPILALFLLFFFSLQQLLSLTLLFSLLSLPAFNWLTSVSKTLFSVIEQNSPLTQVTVYWLLSLQCHCSCWRDIGCWLAPIPSYVSQRANAMINNKFL